MKQIKTKATSIVIILFFIKEKRKCRIVNIIRNIIQKPMKLYHKVYNFMRVFFVLFNFFLRKEKNGLSKANHVLYIYILIYEVDMLKTELCTWSARADKWDSLYIGKFGANKTSTILPLLQRTYLFWSNYKNSALYILLSLLYTYKVHVKRYVCCRYVQLSGRNRPFYYSVVKCIYVCIKFLFYSNSLYKK